jgi:hypothetical protein
MVFGRAIRLAFTSRRGSSTTAIGLRRQSLMRIQPGPVRPCSTKTVALEVTLRAV